MKKEQEIFLEAIRMDPRDDFLRLAYSDFLEENGEAERGEFIRVQVELAQISAVDPLCHVSCWPGCAYCELKKRERKFLHVPCRDCSWHHPIPHWGWSWQFHKGFIAWVRCSLKGWEEHGREICRHHPIQSIHLYDREPYHLMTLRLFESFPFLWQQFSSGLPDRSLTVTGDRHLLPEGLMHAVAAAGLHTAENKEGPRNLLYETRELAQKALSLGLIRYACE